MVVLITGGSGSGKSSYGEDLAVKLNKSELIYIATMKPYGTEGTERVERHKKQRAGKGFKTVEIYEDLHTINLSEHSTVLLECMSNLLANEMFREDIPLESISPEEVSKKIIAGVLHLVDSCENVIIITNEIFGDGDPPYESTRNYTECLGSINRRLSTLSDVFCEVIYGYPYFFKGSDNWRRYENN